MSASAKHNELARRFVFDVASETRSYSEMMVVVESTLFAAMLLLQKQHGLKPGACVEMIETAVQQATDRFAGNAKAEGR